MEFTSVDFPCPLSPASFKILIIGLLSKFKRRTNDHQSEIEALLHGLSVHLIGQTGKTDVAVELLCGWLRLADLLFILVLLSEPTQIDAFVSVTNLVIYLVKGDEEKHSRGISKAHM
jgi:hypothetical protein